MIVTGGLFAVLVAGTCAQSPALGVTATPQTKLQVEVVNYRIAERGPNHKKVIWETKETAPNGKIVVQQHGYTELATGLHYQKGGQWLETKEEFELVPGWAMARNGPHKVGLYYNLNTTGAVAVELPDGRVVRSQVVGLAYLDSTSGQSVVLGLIKDCAGKLLTPNQVIYEDAFTDVKADVRYTYTKAGVAQDIVLRRQLPDPATMGLDPETTMLTVFTEFVDGPTPEVQSEPAISIDDPNVTGRIAVQTATDISLQFGAMKMGRGRAFSLSGTNITTLNNRVPVIKKWVEQQGRKYLFEEVPFSKIQAELGKLPQQSSLGQKKWRKTEFANMQLPTPPNSKPTDKMFETAMADTASAGYVVDYEMVGAALTNYTFQGDMTYYITAPVILMGTNYIEGGAVIKYTNYIWYQGSSGAHLEIGSTTQLIFKTSAYRPAIFTAKDDDRMGETVAGSTGTPSGQYGYACLSFTYMDRPLDVHDVRISYSLYGLDFEAGVVRPTVRNSQFTHNSTAIYCDRPATWQNLLIYDSSRALACFGSTIDAEHLTVDMAAKIFEGGTFNVTNSLFVGASLVTSTNYSTTLNGANNSTNASGAGVFQTVGGAAHYLAASSAYRDVGTTNISPALLDALKAKTTYPPTVYSNNSFSTATSLVPLSIRDTNAPDLGYHYDSLDYVFGGCDLSANMDVAAGTVVSWYYDYGTVFYPFVYGLALNDGANLTFKGTPAQPTKFVSFNTVQEGVGNWLNPGWQSGMVINGSGSAPLPELNATFTKWSCMPGYGGYFRDAWNYGVVRISNSEFFSSVFGSYAPPMYFTNCLFHRTGSYFWGDVDASSFTFQNCTFYNGQMLMKRYYGGSPSFWQIQNCAFDGTCLITYDELNGDTNSTYIDYNAYNPSNTSWTTYPFSWWGAPNTNALEIAGPHDLTVTNYNWQAGYSGDFYLPTNSLLINAGSINASMLGLFHYTTTTNQAKEANSTVDVGYHYIAVGADGLPVDSDGDGVSDMLEDFNGNGITDLGESPFGITIESPQNNSVVY